MLMRKWVLCCTTACCTFFVQAQTSLNKTEQKIAAAIDATMVSTQQLLIESVNINSGTMNVAGVKKVGALYQKEFEAMGFTCEWIAMPDSVKRAGHLVATRKGNKGKRLFIIGHLDTVFEPDMPPNPYRVLNDSTATGQGLNDMKGGDVMVIAALKALHSLGLLKDVSITVYFTGDEENAGHPRQVTRGDFIERARQADIALGFETAVGLSTVATGRRGASGWVLEVEGKQGHSSGVFANGGYGAIYEAVRIVNEFRLQLGNEEFLTFNPGLFAGGAEVNYKAEQQQATIQGKTNIISPKTVVNGDLRFISETQKENARQKMKAIVSSNNLNGTNASIRFSDGIPAMSPKPANDSLVQQLSAISKAMGLEEVKAGNPGSRGAGDISYIAEYVACLDGLGASGRGAHAPGETIHLKEYPLLIKRAALFIYRLTR
ncbi:MAG: M20/M25/M40 family metallo-hydrolase [Flavihumibacter sp.]|nr:M20/M25/M40 family metallo-hydrolase [Flavihumibacter sp.]